MYNAKAYSVASATSPFASTTIARRDPTEHDVQIEILFCGTRPVRRSRYTATSAPARDSIQEGHRHHGREP